MILQIGVKVIIRNNSGKFLLLKREQPMHGETEPSWDIPGGRIEPEEPLHTALAREILEETNLTLDASTQLLAAQDIFVQPKDLHVVRLTYLAEITNNETITISHEHSDYNWLSLKEVLAANLDPYLQEVFSTLIK